MTVKLTVTYDGGCFCGWQTQKNGQSVQQAIESALFTVTGKEIKVVGSGRTDAGVHAEGQVASFTTDGDNIPAEKYAPALNTVLPDGVKIIKSENAADGFNALRSAKKKTYRYSVYLGETQLPLKERYKTRIGGGVDIEKIKSAAKLFEGRHDFKGYCSSGYSAKTTVRTVYSVKVKAHADEIDFFVTGEGFLYNMVRIIVGTLIAAGQDKITENGIKEIFNSGVRNPVGKTLPAKGLCLVKVEY